MKEGPEAPGEAPERGWAGGRTAFPSPRAPSMKLPLVLPPFQLGLGQGSMGVCYRDPHGPGSSLSREP